jgi:hypothetical protein
MLLAEDFIETITLTGTRKYVLAVIEHTSRRIRIVGATAHPSARANRPASASSGVNRCTQR